MNWSSSRVLVTGGCGFIGSHIVDRLLGLGASVTVVDYPIIRDEMWDLRLGNYLQIWENHDIKVSKLKNDFVARDHYPLVMLDLEHERAKFAAVVKGHDVVFHLAALFGGRGFVDTRQADCCVGFGINHNVIAESLAAGVERIHFSSSACVYPPALNRQDCLLREEDALTGATGWDLSDNTYGWVKLMAELELKAFLEQYGLKSSIARYLTVYGPWELDESHAIAALLRRALRRENPFVVWGTGNQERGFTYVDDIAEGSILAAEKISDATPINLGTDVRYRISDVVKMILDVEGFRSAQVVFDSSKPEGPYSRALDISRARKLLGWSPKTDLADGLRKTHAWLVQKPVPLVKA
jgi:UDP-glucose 4-epimerase